MPNQVRINPGPADEVAADMPQAAPAGSPLFDLRKIREEKVKALYTDLQVPRWGEPGKDGKPTPKIFVRYGPTDPNYALKRTEKRRTEKDPDWVINVNADVLVHACIGVYAKVGDDPTEYSLRVGDPLGDWTRFDPDLAEALGFDPKIGAAGVAKSLYLTPGDLLAAASQLGEWSGIALPKADEDALGE